MRTRIRSTIWVVALAAATALFIGTPGAVASQDSPVLAGNLNTANIGTTVVDTSEISVNSCFTYGGLNGCGETGVVGRGTSRGVTGFGPTASAESANCRG
jgi:hypothetical protein